MSAEEIASKLLKDSDGFIRIKPDTFIRMLELFGKNEAVKAFVAGVEAKEKLQFNKLIHEEHERYINNLFNNDK